MLKTLRWVGAGLLVLALAVFAIFCITEYRPDEFEELRVTPVSTSRKLQIGDRFTILSFNTGHGCMGRDSEVEGKNSKVTTSAAQAKENVLGILNTVAGVQPDLCLLQDVDMASARSGQQNQNEEYRRSLGMEAAFATSQKNFFLPGPPMGSVENGLMTASSFTMSRATREALTDEYRWPASIFQSRHCLLTCRFEIEGTDRELVVFNLQMEKCQNEQIRRMHWQQLLAAMELEYRNGNAVIAGGSFGYAFDGGAAFPPLKEEDALPALKAEKLPAGISCFYDGTVPYRRLADRPYTGNRRDTLFYV